MFFALLTPILSPCFSSPKVFKNLLVAHIFPSTLSIPTSFIYSALVVSPSSSRLGSRSHRGSTSVLEFLLSREHPTPPACSSSLPRNRSCVVDHTVTEAVEMAQWREHCKKRGVVTWASIAYYTTLLCERLSCNPVTSLQWGGAVWYKSYSFAGKPTNLTV